MSTHPLRHDDRSDAAWLATGFVAGALAVLVFHQGALALLHAAGISARGAYVMTATPPFGIPQVLSLAFWGGVWGLAGAALFRRMRGAGLVIAMLVFGAIAPTLVAWFVVAPLKGQPMAGGFKAAAMATALIINGAWGLGTGLGLAAFGSRHRDTLPA